MFSQSRRTLTIAIIAFAVILACILIYFIVPTAPILLFPPDGVTLTQASPISTQYLALARDAYSSEDFSDYQTSVISQFDTSPDSFNDRPTPITLNWEGFSSRNYTLELSTSDRFIPEQTVQYNTESSEITIYHLRSGTTYYWRVSSGIRTSKVYSFTTEDSVRWIYADGIRNVRDIGGWNGLNQGLVYRGSELNTVKNHGLQITDEARQVLVNELGIRSDLDLRALTIDDRGDEMYFTESPLGKDVRLLNHPITHFLSAFEEPESYRAVLAEFANPDNYPIYMHCWGGADRTGTVAFLLGALCNVSEADLAADLELTSFASFGFRYRYDNNNFLYASTVNRLKEYPGDSLQEKAEYYALNTLGLSRGEISNIQSILTGSGATISLNSLATPVLQASKDSFLTVELLCPDGQTVETVTIGTTEHRYDFSNGTLVVFPSLLDENNISGRIMTIVLSDGSQLKIDVEYI